MENNNYLGTEKVGVLLRKFAIPLYLFTHYLVSVQHC